MGELGGDGQCKGSRIASSGAMWPDVAVKRGCEVADGFWRRLLAKAFGDGFPALRPFLHLHPIFFVKCAH